MTAMVLNHNHRKDILPGRKEIGSAAAMTQTESQGRHSTMTIHYLSVFPRSNGHCLAISYVVWLVKDRH